MRVSPPVRKWMISQVLCRATLAREKEQALRGTCGLLTKGEVDWNLERCYYGQ